LLLGASACGSGGSGGRLTTAALLATIDRTRAVTTAHMQDNFSAISPEGDEQGSVGGSADFATTTGTVTVAGSSGMVEHAVFRDGSVWLTSNAARFTAAMPAGRRWVTAPASTLEAIGAFQSLGNSLAVLDALRGVQTLHAISPRAASFTFSLPLALARTPPARRGALERAIHVSGPGVVETGSVTLYSDGVLRDERLAIDGRGVTAGLHLALALSLTDVGAPVNVTPPPASETVALRSVPALEQLLRGSAGG
jgi:hypothetical protein